MGYTVFGCLFVCLFYTCSCYVRVLKGMHTRIHSQGMGILTMKRIEYLTRYFPGNIGSKTKLC